MQKIPSIKELRQTVSKQSTKGFLNPLCDFLAFYPAKIFLYLPFNPVQITVIWILIKIVTALLMTTGTYQSTGKALILLVSALGVFSYLLSKAITMNGIWVSNLEMRKEMETIVY